jgi:hypothetical protein
VRFVKRLTGIKVIKVCIIYDNTVPRIGRSFLSWCVIIYRTGEIIIKVFFYSPTDKQVSCLKNIFEIYIKINIKTAPTCFGAVTPPSGSALFVLAKVTVIKIAN